jgi:hypothetical protein
MKLIHAQIAEAQKNYDTAKRELLNAAVKAGIPEENVLTLRQNARELFDVLRELDQRILNARWL